MGVFKPLFVLCVFLVIAVLGTPVTTVKKHTGLKVSQNNISENSTLKAAEISPKGIFPRTNLPPVVVSQGVCGITRRPLIYTENFILENDKKSQVLATMTIGISGTPNITCVAVISRSHDEVRPLILSGGVGSNFVEVGVKPGYGDGFDFTVKLFGSYNIQPTDAIDVTSPTNVTDATHATNETGANNTTDVITEVIV